MGGHECDNKGLQCSCDQIFGALIQGIPCFCSKLNFASNVPDEWHALHECRQLLRHLPVLSVPVAWLLLPAERLSRPRCLPRHQWAVGRCARRRPRSPPWPSSSSSPSVPGPVAARARRRAWSACGARRAALGRRPAGRRAVRLRGRGARRRRCVGFEVELADALARALGVRARFVQNDWSTLIPSLERGTFDVALNGIEVTPARAARVAFSRPYYRFAERLVARAGRRARARSRRRCAGCASARWPARRPGTCCVARARSRSRTRASTSRSSISSTGASTPCCSTTSSSTATRPATPTLRGGRRRRRGAATRSRAPQDERTCGRRSIARSAPSWPAAAAGARILRALADSTAPRQARLAGAVDAPAPRRRPRAPGARWLDARPARAVPAGRARRRC